MARLGSALLALALLGAWGGQAATAPAQDRRAALAQVRSWGVQLTGYGSARLGPVAASPFGLVVVDPVDDAGQPWTAPELRAAARGRLLVAYLSVGAAESYRPYWQAGWRPGRPAWLLREQSAWPGNYDVAYWNPEWQRVALRQLAAVLAQGFGGVYLDLIDAYEQHPERPAARAEMVAWVCRIAAYARARDPQFLIIPQNAAALIREPGFAACVDAAGQEETFVYATDRPTEALRRRTQLADFALWRAAGKPVLTIEYAERPDLRASAAAQARAAGLVPYVAGRALDRLAPQPLAR